MLSVLQQNRDTRCVDRATATLPQTVSAAIFTITGTVEVLQLVGEVTTVIGAVADLTKITYDPTAAGASTDLCTTTDIQSVAVGYLCYFTGAIADPMQVSTGTGCGTGQALTWLLAPGSLKLDCAASTTGYIKWSIVYRPISQDACIKAA